MFKFEPGDIILFDMFNYPKVIRSIARWLLGSEWGHVGIFFAYTKRYLPLIIESLGRGVLMRSLLASQGRKVKVMRWNEATSGVGDLAAEASEHLADNPSSWYGYWDIPRFVIPRLIWAKLFGRRRKGLGYRRNNHFICSELVDQAYINAGHPLFASDFIPLPGDFEVHPFLKEVWSGKL